MNKQKGIEVFMGKSSVNITFIFYYARKGEHKSNLTKIENKIKKTN